MKLTEAMKIIDDRWIRRYKGFRVRFQKRQGEAWATEEFPDPTSKPLTSEVSAWELARRFAEATANHNPDQNPNNRMINIHVVDDQGNAIPFYATHQFHVFNRMETGGD